MTHKRQEMHYVGFTHFQDFAGGHALISVVQGVGGQHTDFETGILAGKLRGKIPLKKRLHME